jgi:hypothetical protein
MMQPTAALLDVTNRLGPAVKDLVTAEILRGSSLGDILMALSSVTGAVGAGACRISPRDTAAIHALIDDGVTRGLNAVHLMGAKAR